MFDRFFVWTYWVGNFVLPLSLQAYQITLWVLVALAVVGLALGLGGRYSKGSYRLTYRRLATLSLTIALLSAVTLFFVQTSTPVLGLRVWFLFWLIIAVVWLFFIVKQAVRSYKQAENSRSRREIYTKYLPRSR